MTSGAIENRRARLVEYAPWILRDYLMNQGPSTAVVVLLIGAMSLGPAMALSGVSLGNVPEPLARRMLQPLVEALAFLGAFFATNGIVANDRKFGFFRFLFAKPVSPPRYYACTFALYGAGLLVVALALMALWAAVVRPMFSAQALFTIVLIYVAYGGVGFLLSALWRFDWLSLVTVLLVANVGWKVWGSAVGLRHWVLYLLPPVHRANEVFELVLHDTFDGMPWTSIIWLGGYGLACFLLGIWVIRKRPLGTS